MKLTTNTILKFFVFIIFLLLIFFSKEGQIGAQKGLIIAATILVPSLFPFTVCSLFALKINFFSFLKPIENIIMKIFGQNYSMFCVFLLSMIGGYPVGAKLINELYDENKISKAAAQYMLCFCVNAGPAFIISAVGIGILNSKVIGIAILTSHILSSVLISLFCAKPLKSAYKKINNTQEIDINFSNIFVRCISEGANSVIKISAFVTFFSSLYAVLSALPLKFLNYVLDTLEVTNTISKCNNLYLIVFWLGFSGISIWCQVFSLIDGCGINYKLFIFSRILHGILSTMFFNAYIHIFNIKIQTISNSVNIIFKDNYAPMHLAVAIFVLVIFLLISFESKRTNILYNDLM